VTTTRNASSRHHAAPARLRMVLVATDFSPGCAPALARAALLPLAPRAKIILATVACQGCEAEEEEQLRHRLQRQADALQRRVRRRAAQVRVEPLLLHGSPHEQIAACAATAGVDLVVVGRHGRRPLADLFGLGTTADRLVRLADAPVLVAHGRARASYRRPLAAADRPMAPATRRAIRAGRRLTPPTAGWTAVHVDDDLQGSALRRGRVPAREIAEFYRAEGLRLRREVAAELSRAFPDLRWAVRLEWGEPRILVPEMVARRRADLIVVGARTRRSLDRRLLGTVGEAVLRRAACDVLIAPAPVERRRAAKAAP